MKSFLKKMKPKAFHKSEKLLNIGKNQCCVVVMFLEEPLVPIPKIFMGSILVWVLIRFLFYIKLGPSSRSKSNFFNARVNFGSNFILFFQIKLVFNSREGFE